MALRILKANDEKLKLTQRKEQVEQELSQIQDTEVEYQQRYQEIKDSDNQEEIEKLFDLDQELETRKKDLTKELNVLNEKINELEQEIKEFNKGEIMETKVEKKEELEIRSQLNEYLHTKNIEEVRAAGFTSEEGEAIIPEEIIYQPRDEVYTESDLEQYVNVVSVSTTSGRYPILKRTAEKMHTVEELAQNPQLGNPKFEDVRFDVDTYRGYIPISQEAIDDAAVDLVNLISRHILRIKLNTTNGELAPIFKSFTPVITKDIDGIKKIKNVMIDPAYQITYFMTQSMFDYIDTLKDNNGHYLFQNDITSPSGKRLFGSNVVVLRDTLLGDYNGHLCCFMGDAKAGITMFDRKQISAKWIDSEIYGQKIQSGFRADFEKTDGDAGYFVTLAPVERDLKLATQEPSTPETVAGVSVTWATEDNKLVAKFEGLTGQPIAGTIKNGEGTTIAAMAGTFTLDAETDQLTFTFGPNMPKGEYTIDAQVLDSKKYKNVSEIKLTISALSDSISRTYGAPIVISGK